MNAENRFRFNKMLNTTQRGAQPLKLVSSENHAIVSAIFIKPKDSGTIYSPLPILHQIFNRADKYVYSSPDSIKSSPVDGITACALIVPLASNPDFP